MKLINYFVFFLALLFVASDAAVTNSCRISMRNDMLRIYNQFHRIASSEPAMRAAFLRAGFHDCAPVSSAKRDSGCNGSLRLELEDDANTRLTTAVRRIMAFKRNVSPCVSYADSIMLAYTASVIAMGDFGLAWDTLVDPNNPRPDSNTPDFLVSTGKLDLPSGGTTDFGQLFRYYQARGMSGMHVVASLMVGHSVGGFGKEEPISQFLPSTNSAPSLYGINLLSRSKSGTDLSGFNTLPSDRALINHENAKNALSTLTTGRSYEDSTSLVTQFARTAVNNNGTVAPWPLAGQLKTKRLFFEFCVKMSKLSGASMQI